VGFIRKASGIAVVVSLALAALACGSEPRRYPARGVVEDVLAERYEVLVAHEEIPGLMPAMTMSFGVRNPELIRRLKPGQIIDFMLEVDDGRYAIIAAAVVGNVDEGAGWSRFGDVLVRSDPAPDFVLQDQEGESLALADLQGQLILLDFIFTRCPGPCPILTSTHVSVQRGLSQPVRDRTSFVSITLDPEFDSPAELAGYARSRGIDTTDWSLLTGDPEEVDRVVRAFGVGRTKQPDGNIEHIVVTFLIDENGQIVKRYIGQDHDPADLVADLERLAS